MGPGSGESSCGLEVECAVRWWRRMGGGMSEPVLVSGTFPAALPEGIGDKGLTMLSPETLRLTPG